MALTNFKLLICLLILSESTLAQAKCLGTVSELKANNVKARWQETTENDGKPLIISITKGANGLVYSAKKAGALWLTGNVSVCLSGGATEITLKNTQATSNVPMLARLALPSTQSAQIVNDQTRLGGAIGRGGTTTLVSDARRKSGRPRAVCAPSGGHEGHRLKPPADPSSPGVASPPPRRPVAFKSIVGPHAVRAVLTPSR